MQRLFLSFLLCFSSLLYAQKNISAIQKNSGGVYSQNSVKFNDRLYIIQKGSKRLSQSGEKNGDDDRQNELIGNCQPLTAMVGQV